MKHSFVYILRCSDESYYVGVTNNIQRRFIEHQSGINETAYTHSRRPVELAYYEEFTDIRVAIAREKQLKGWSRAKKEVLIKSNLNNYRIWQRRSLVSERNQSFFGTRFSSALRMTRAVFLK